MSDSLVPWKRKRKRSSGFPSRHSNRILRLPVIRSFDDFERYALDKVGIRRAIWKDAADAFCDGDLIKLLRNIESDSSLKTLLVFRPQAFKFFLESQVPYWSGKLPCSYPEGFSSDVGEEVHPSSIILFTYLPHETRSFNRFHVYSIAPALTLSRITMDEIPDYHRPACVVLGKLVVFIGGVCKFADDYYSSKKMFAFYILENDSHSPVLKLPNMNVGKSKPLALVAKNKIYVLSLSIREDHDTMVSRHTFGFSPNYRDWTLVDNHFCADWYCGAFEVFEPSTGEWTILPLPHDPLCGFKPPRYMPTVHRLSLTIGHAVVRDRLFFFSNAMGSCLYTFDTRTLCWKFYDKRTRETVEAQDFYDSLVYQLLDNGMCGQGLVVKDTLYAFSPKPMQNEDDLDDRFCIWAYHIPESLNDKKCHSGPLQGFTVDCVYGASVVYVGDGTFGCVHVKKIKEDDSDDDDLPPFDVWVRTYVPPQLRPCFTTFKVSAEAGNGGKRVWHAESTVENEFCGLDNSKKSFLACFAC